MLEGLDVLIGAEALIGEGLAAGELRGTIERFPRIGALKAAAAARGAPIREDVRPPLRRLTDDERRELLDAIPR